MSKYKKIDRNNTNAATMTLLILASLALTASAYAASGQPSDTGKMPDVPGIPDNAVQYNKTDVTPVAQMEQVMAGEPALYLYRNTIMLMNCTRNCDLVVTVDPTVKPKLLGLSVDPNQTMTLTMNLSGFPLEGEGVMERSLNFYWGIEPNAMLQLMGQLRIHINQTELSQELNGEVNASRLTWMYWNKTRAEWETVPSFMDQNGYLVCNTDHFSTWTVAEIQDTTEAKQNGMNLTYVYAIFAVVVVVVLGVGIAVVKKRN